MLERKITTVITAGMCPIRVKELLKRGLKMSGSCLAALKRGEDGIMVNGERVKVTRSLNAGDEITVTLRDEIPSENIIPEDIPVDVVYEDEDILAVNKPAGMPTHISPGHYSGTLSNAVMGYYGGEFVFRAVNRLDAGTSGLMLIAKNAYAHERLSSQIKAGNFHRKYLAIVRGTPEEKGVIDAPIAREAGSAIKRIVSPEGKRAVTRWQLIESAGGYSLAEVAPETGRTHQIRVHMAHIGHPLAGDWLYGTENDGMSRHALHSYHAELIQPVTGESLTLEAPMAEDMRAFWGKCKNAL